MVFLVVFIVSVIAIILVPNFGPVFFMSNVGLVSVGIASSLATKELTFNTNEESQYCLLTIVRCKINKK